MSHDMHLTRLFGEHLLHLKNRFSHRLPISSVALSLLHHSHLPMTRSHNKPFNVNVLGAGVSGLSTALALLEKGHYVVKVVAHTPPLGPQYRLHLPLVWITDACTDADPAPHGTRIHFTVGTRTSHIPCLF